MAINTFFIVGEVKRVTITEPKKGNPDKGASAVVLVQYGPERERTNRAVEFVNATLIRIPSYKFPQMRDRLRVGQTVVTQGTVQGVFKTSPDGTGTLVVELVANRIDIERQTGIRESENATRRGNAVAGDAPDVDNEEAGASPVAAAAAA